MKKFRGKKRYFRKLWRQTEVDTCDIRLDEWFDFWHRHLDFYGIGNNSLKFRKEHIKAHMALYNNFLKELATCNQPYQSWVLININDAGQDAVYIHTPNPNDDNYPYKNQDIDWGCSIPKSFKELIDINCYNVGFLNDEYGKFYYIQSKFHGTPL
ncbi:hypothetical protein RRU94_02160 [Domibacillus sp. DTU_2020_1001157_1_SI_ALB_TIR_016]|uniref:hypothetical protein n=1 Tax=Domibacillus sp. DTU_2020_1001157_1_SI_ALB_TIR_016 TaxID=3077789 RepID=UPI0028EB3340|nr:hypothetical protein [Domibacillus sp. DTU_2020_1001157_1_SI_ALB_TIR_016]WNS78772.1 hypothetical protein RRU94_02160 [Domibacillus sp. DTU_2020_1001157_1_SI_ALB_TIR_016]